jgi:hypothetical protein
MDIIIDGERRTVDTFCARSLIERGEAVPAPPKVERAVKKAKEARQR